MRTAKTVWLQWAMSVMERQSKNNRTNFSSTRRNFLKHTTKSAVGLAIVPGFLEEKYRRKPRIAIIGGGLAGLSCAWRLKQAGFNPTVYEASDRFGGRTYSVEEFNKNGHACEIGGEFFTSDHRHLLKLTRELKLKIFTASSPNRHLKPFKVFLGEEEVPLEKLEQSLSDFFELIKTDLEGLPETISWESADKFRDIDALSIPEYIKNRGGDALTYKFLCKAFTFENGIEAKEQSALNLLTTFRKGFIYQPSSKIRSMQVKGGNQQICSELASKMWNNVVAEHRLVDLHQHTSWYKLTFKNGKRTKTINADYVVMTVPFSVMRKINHNVHFNPRKEKAIQELGYGKKGSLLLGFNKKTWRDQGYDGLTFSDEKFGYGSDLSPKNKGKHHVLSVKPSGKEAEDFSMMDTVDAAMKSLRSFDKIYPGLSKQFDGQAMKFSWSDNPLSMGSNSCYKVGQYTEFGGEEGKSVENLFFAGEHCSNKFRGTMNGAVVSGDLAASNIIRRLSRSKRKLKP